MPTKTPRRTVRQGLETHEDRVLAQVAGRRDRTFTRSRTLSLQVYLDERDLKSLEAWASDRGWTKSQAIRAAVRALVRSAKDPILRLSGIADGLPPDSSERLDHYLNQTYIPERPAPYRARGRRRKPVRR